VFHIDKFAVIGGGSTYTPELLEGWITHQDQVRVEVISLYDIHPQRLAILGDFALRMFRHAGLETRIELHDRLEPALEGAAFVLSQIRVGGMSARILDEKIPLSHGVLGQETVGAGGLASALRTIPVSLRIAAEVERRAPQAWYLNFTNPSGVITEALIKYSRLKKVVGLCNVPINSHIALANLLGVAESELWLDWVGLNHLGWIRDVSVGGRSRMAEALAMLCKPDSEEAHQHFPFPPGVFETLQMIPTYYLRYYYSTPQAIDEVRAAGRTRGEVVAEIEKELLTRYSDPSLEVKPPELSQRGGALYSEAAFRLIFSILADRRDVQVLIVRNGGSIPGLPEDAAVEVPCVVGANGVTPLTRGTLPPSIYPLLEAVKTSESLCVEAAVSGSRREALQAMLVHPLLPDFARAERITDELLAAHRAYLPQFFQ